MAQLIKNLPAMWETWVRSLGWEDPLEKAKATHSSILAWRIPWTIPFSVFMWFIYNTLNAFVPIFTLSCLPHPDRFFLKNLCNKIHFCGVQFYQFGQMHRVVLWTIILYAVPSSKSFSRYSCRENFPPAHDPSTAHWFSSLWFCPFQSAVWIESNSSGSGFFHLVKCR